MGIIIYTILMTAFFHALGEKLNWFNIFHKWASKQKSKFIYDLSSCKFCIRFHLGVISFIIVVILSFLNIEYILTPFCVAGFFKIIDYDNKA